MPIAKFQMPDGRIAKFEVSEGTTPEQAQQVFNDFMAKQQPKETNSRSWASVPFEAVTNFPSSLGHVIGGVAEAVSSPVETTKNLAKALKGGIQNATGFGYDKEAQQIASNIGQFYKQRYGSEEGFKNALATDPAGVLADASSILGIGAAAKIPGLAKAAATVDPLVMALRGGSKVIDKPGGIAKLILGKTSGVGGEAVGEAYKAGKKGNAAFLENMRDQVPMTDVLEAAKSDLSEMVRQKQAEYRAGMAGIKSDKSVLNLSGVDSAIQKAFDRLSFKDQIKDKKAIGYVSEVRELVDNWKNLEPSEYHTPEGLDALKQQVGAVLEDIPFEQKNSKAVVGDIYNAIKSEITNQAPKYAEVMSDYSQASDQIKEIERALSLGQKASADTAMRKLQSLMRNNVNTSYGYRQELAKALEKAGGKEIMPSLAGQAMKEWMPRGLQGAALAPTSMLAYGAGGIPLTVLNAALSSPRLVGESSYKAGQLANKLEGINGKLKDGRIDPRVLANALYQSGQIGNAQ